MTDDVFASDLNAPPLLVDVKILVDAWRPNGKETPPAKITCTSAYDSLPTVPDGIRPSRPFVGEFVCSYPHIGIPKVLATNYHKLCNCLHHYYSVGKDRLKRTETTIMQSSSLASF